jgi:hypothetical protein
LRIFDRTRIRLLTVGTVRYLFGSFTNTLITQRERKLVRSVITNRTLRCVKLFCWTGISRFIIIIITVSYEEKVGAVVGEGVGAEVVAAVVAVTAVAAVGKAMAAVAAVAAVAGNIQ